MNKLILPTSFLLVLLLPGCGGGGGGGGKKGPPASSAPAAPTRLAASAGVGEVQLSWSASSGADAYRVYRGAAAGLTPASGTLVTTTVDTSALLTGLTNGLKQWFIVTAVNAQGEGPPSKEVSATPDAGPGGVPTPPRSLAVEDEGDHVVLHWSASPGATSYNVYQAFSPGVPQTPSHLAGNVLTSGASVTGLVPGVRVFFAVSAVSSRGESALSAEVSVTPGGPGQPSGGTQAPPPPNKLMGSLSGSTLSISWQGSSTALGYNVYASPSPGVEPATATLLGYTASTSAVLSSLPAGLRMYLVVTAFNTVGESGASNEIAVQVPGSPGGSAPRPGIYRGIWNSNLLDTELEVGYLDSSNAILMWYSVEGFDLFGSSCSNEIQFTRPHVIEPDFSFQIVLPGQGGDDEITGRFFSTTQVSGEILHRNDDWAGFGCNPPARGPFSAVWAGTARSADPESGSEDVQALPIPGMPTLRLEGPGRPRLEPLPAHVRALYR